MAATQTVAQRADFRKLSESRNPSEIQLCDTPFLLKPRHGVLTLFGYGINIRVERGHLIVEDGIGEERSSCRLPRVGHGLKRLVVIGSDGSVSLAALRWLTDQDAAFVMLERDGRVLSATGPVRSADVKLRRAQALAHHSGAALRVSRELIYRKLVGQEQVARRDLKNDDVANMISDFRLSLAETDSIDAVRFVESRAAKAYWSAWRETPVNFPSKALSRLPDHWRKFAARVSPLTHSTRLAVNPANAMLNYLYAILEAETRLAIAALGLDPGMGVLHVDTTSRDSLACDLMEPIRPQVDAYLLKWVQEQTLSCEWFFEQRNGNCRLMPALATRLSQTAATWHRAVAPIAEFVAQAFWSALKVPKQDRSLPTHLTQSNRREARGMEPKEATPPPTVPKLCKGCGKPLKSGTSVCGSCDRITARERMLAMAEKGRVLSHTEEAHSRISATQRRHAAARLAWNPNDRPSWLTREVYISKIQPHLKELTVSSIALAIHASLPYATKLRKGIRVPHPMHWLTLANLVSLDQS